MDKGIESLVDNLQLVVTNLMDKYGWKYDDVMDMSTEKLLGVLENELKINHLRSLNDDVADEPEEIKPLSKDARAVELLSQAAQLLQEANELTDTEDDYINIRIPKKGDVPIIEFKGQRYGEMPEQGLESIKLLWVTDDGVETNLSERLSFDAVYFDRDMNPVRNSISIGNTMATESNMCRVAESNSELN